MKYRMTPLLAQFKEGIIKPLRDRGIKGTGFITLSEARDFWNAVRAPEVIS
jgi:hypothetical protein